MFQVFQIQLGEDYTPEKLEAKREMQHFGSESNVVEYFKFYKNVCTVLAKDAEDAFMLMNAWNDRSKVINEEGERPRSLSVGDILFSPVAKQYYMVDGLGFTDVTDQVEYALA